MKDTPEYLARYSNWLLKTGMKKLNDDQKSKRISELTAVTFFLNEKDVFFAYYQRFLAERLLNETMLSDEYERNFIIALRNQCGQANIKKINEMIGDISESKALCEEFRPDVQEKFPINVDNVNINILRNGSWPAVFKRKELQNM